MLFRLIYKELHQWRYLEKFSLKFSSSSSVICLFLCSSWLIIILLVFSNLQQNIIMIFRGSNMIIFDRRKHKETKCNRRTWQNFCVNVIKRERRCTPGRTNMQRACCLTINWLQVIYNWLQWKAQLVNIHCKRLHWRSYAYWAHRVRLLGWF